MMDEWLEEWKLMYEIMMNETRQQRLTISAFHHAQYNTQVSCT